MAIVFKLENLLHSNHDTDPPSPSSMFLSKLCLIFASDGFSAAFGNEAPNMHLWNRKIQAMTFSPFPARSPWNAPPEQCLSAGCPLSQAALLRAPPRSPPPG